MTKKTKSNRVCYAVIADTHCGHALGLINPGVVLWHQGKSGLVEYTPKLNEYNLYDWHDVYIPGIKMVQKFSAGTPLKLLHLSDLIQGDKYDNVVQRENQIIIAQSIFEPWLKFDNLAEVSIVGGTDAHDPGYLPTISVAKNLNETNRVPIKATLHSLIQRPDGYEIDYAHHGPHPGIRGHTRGRIAAYSLRDLINIELKYRGKCADLYLRAHRHNLVDIKDHDGEYLHWSRLIVAPALSGMNGFARKVTQDFHLLKTGMFAFIVEDGRMVAETWHIKTLDLRTVEEL